jgi:hypothetical protein
MSASAPPIESDWLGEHAPGRGTAVGGDLLGDLHAVVVDLEG